MSIQFMFKASSRAHFEQWALEKGWLKQGTDDNGQPVLLRANGASISHIGPVQLTKAVYEGGGGRKGNTLVTPATYDNDHHVNVKLRGALANAEKDAAAVEQGKSELSETQINEVMPVEEAGKGEVEGEEGKPPPEPQALSTVTGLEFTKDATLEPQGKAEGWRVTVGDGWVARLDEASIKTPKRVWQ